MDEVPTGSDETLTVLSEDECWSLLGEAEIGRLAIAPVGSPEIFPVTFTVANRVLYFRTAPGLKLLELAVNPTVAFEIDGWDERSAFSVVVKGTAERLEKQADIDAADLLPLVPWLPTLKYRWVRIVPTSVSGHSFLRGVEPARY